VTDILNLENEAQNIFIYEICELIADDMTYADDMQKFQLKLGKTPDGRLTGGGLYGDYMRDKPSEKIRPTSKYYTLRPRSNRYNK
jgi:hypothetical protein